MTHRKEGKTMRNVFLGIIACFFIMCSTCSVCSNLAFAVPLPAVSITCEATDVTASSATLSGVVHYYAEPAGTLTVWFEYGTTRDNYSNTSSIQTVNGTDTTIDVSIGISNLSPDTTYYYMIAATYYYRVATQSEFAEGGGREKLFTTLSATPTTTGMPTPTPNPTFDCNCEIPGRVTDAITKKGIEHATISERTVSLGTSFTDSEGYYRWVEGESPMCCGGAYTLTASADGYQSLSQLIDIEPCIPRTLDFELQPVATPTPVPTVTPISECAIKKMAVFPSRLRLKSGESGEVVVRLRGDNCVPEGSIVTAAIDKAGSRRITIPSMNEAADEHGEATFTIVAKEKPGSARVTFKANQLEKTILVKVRR